jgi:histidinol phosphatase-like enzyme
MTKPAVFLDRDGTLIEERGYLDRMELLELFPWTADALRLVESAPATRWWS